MSKRLKRKVALMIVVELVFLALLGGLLMVMQTNLSVADQKGNIEEKLAQMPEIIEEADLAAAQATESYDDVFNGKAGSIAYMYQNGVIEGYTPANMQELRDVLDVDNVLIIDKEGNIIAAAKETPADFHYERYNMLRHVFRSGEPADATEVQIDDTTYRFYGAKIDNNVMAVVQQDPTELKNQLDATSTWESILSNITVGLNGYSMGISTKDYTFLYHPDQKMIGQDALTAGVSVDDLEEGNYTWMDIDGQRVYCGVTKIEDAYILCAVTSQEILASRNATVGLVLFTFFAVITLVTTYAFFIMGDGERDHIVEIKDNLFFNKTVGRKISTISVIGLICILIVSMYMQTIFSLSRQSMSNQQRIEEVEEQIDAYAQEKAELEGQYNERYLNKAQIAEYILSGKPELANRDSLASLAQTLSVDFINVFNSKGVQVATNSPYTIFEISDNPEDQSYEFKKLLSGGDYLIQEARADDVSGEYHQYIGVVMRDKEYNPKGFTQISVAPSKLEETIANMKIDKILSKIKVGNGGIVFAVDKKENQFLYHPEEKLIGRDAASYGMKKAQFVDDYTGYLNIGDTKYYGSSLEMEDYYVYAAVPVKEIGGARMPITVVSVLASLVVLIIVFLLLTITRKRDEEEEAEPEYKKFGDTVNVSMPDGEKKRTISAASRWSHKIIHWSDKTAEQRLFMVLKVLLAILALVICIAVVFQDQLLGETSIFRFIISGKWARGVNIFAVTGCILILCVVNVVTMFIQQILGVMAHTFGAKGETVCRLLRSLVKYGSVIAVLYYCLALIGIDTKTLLASAGILSLVVGLGAQTLVSDILAGLFIIFEGEFRVGDIVTIGDFRGTVVEIGIRTTKIQDGSQNVKIISNSDVCGVLNMTKDYSYAWVDVGIEYGESLERVEYILEQEFPNIRKHIPGILDGPFYKGVVALADNSVNIRVMVLCSEGDRIQMERDLNREMKLIFDKHDINVPFPQVVINQPVEFKQATIWQKMQAEKFNKTQRELSGNLLEEEEDH